MLGPSDYRKNFTYILDDFTDYNRNLKKLFEHRLSEEETRVLLHDPDELIKNLIQKHYALDHRSENFITRYFEFGSQKLLNFTHNFSILNGFSVGNIIIGGIYAETNDFNLALYILTTQFELTAKIINISAADDSKLVAFDGDGNFLANEADIVNYEGNKPLSEFYLLPLDELNALDKQGNYNKEEIEKNKALFFINFSKNNFVYSVVFFGLINIKYGTLIKHLSSGCNIQNKQRRPPLLHRVHSSVMKRMALQ